MLCPLEVEMSLLLFDLIRAMSNRKVAREPIPQIKNAWSELTWRCILLARCKRKSVLHVFERVQNRDSGSIFPATHSYE